MNRIKESVRRFVNRIARWLNAISGGWVTPNAVTLTGLAAHLPIAILIADQQNYLAAVLLVIFGLFDTLDGELARVQNRASTVGMVLDASTDRMKEVLLYTGAAYALIASDSPYMAIWAVAACGFSLTVSYVKAKGETALVDSKMTANQRNKSLFRDGVAPFEIRIALLVLGLLTGQLGWAVLVIAILSAYTAAERLIKVTRALRRVQD